jgi:hypothetical protein
MYSLLATPSYASRRPGLSLLPLLPQLCWASWTTTRNPKSPKPLHPTINPKVFFLPSAGDDLIVGEGWVRLSSSPIFFLRLHSSSSFPTTTNGPVQTLIEVCGVLSASTWSLYRDCGSAYRALCVSFCGSTPAGVPGWAGPIRPSLFLFAYFFSVNFV